MVTCTFFFFFFGGGGENGGAVSCVMCWDENE